MAAYFIKYSYVTLNGNRRDNSCIIDYKPFEKVNSESFYRKFNDVIKEGVCSNSSPIIESVTKL